MRERGRGDVNSLTLHWREIAIEQMGLSDQDDDNIYIMTTRVCVCVSVCLSVHVPFCLNMSVCWFFKVVT